MQQHPFAAVDTRKASVVLVVLTALAVAAFMVFGTSTAAFVATTANEDNSWESGGVTLTDDETGAALFTAVDVLPGYSETQDIVVTYTGPADADVTLTAAGAGGLAEFLDVTIARDGAPVFDGTVADLADPIVGADLATTFSMASGVPTTYEFVVTMDADTGNAAQNLPASADFTWNSSTSQ